MREAVKSKTTITKVFKQLNEFNLIKEERQGLNKPNRIYIAHLEPLPVESERGKKEPKDLENSRKYRKWTSRSTRF